MAIQDRAGLTTLVGTNLPDGGNIPSSDHRAVEVDIIDSNLNLVDNIDQGTFVPTLTDVGGGATYTIGFVRLAEHTRILDTVQFNICIDGISTAGGPSGVVRLGGLPFASKNVVGASYPVNISLLTNDDVDFNSMYPFVVTGQDYIHFRIKDGNSDSPSIDDLWESVDLGPLAILHVGGTYRITEP